MQHIRVTVVALLALLAALALLRLPPAAAQDRNRAALLVAKPGLADPTFRETVVLVTQDAGAISAGGTAGVIINRPTNRSLASILPGERFARYIEPVFFGGPVMNQGLFAIYRAEKPLGDSLTMLPGVYLALQPPTLDSLLHTPPQTIRFYAGLSGWAPGQLQAEIERGDWFVLNADPETVFAHESEAKVLWTRFLRIAKTVTAGIATPSGSIPSFSLPRGAGPTRRSHHPGAFLGARKPPYAWSLAGGNPVPTIAAGRACRLGRIDENQNEPGCLVPALPAQGSAAAAFPAFFSAPRSKQNLPAL